MSSKNLLPFPKLVSGFEECLSCGYSLEGIPSPRVCPECGLGMEVDGYELVLWGVAKGMTGPVWRKVVWICLGVMAFVYSQLLGLFITALPWIGLLIFLFLVASTIGMVLSNQQKSKGSEIFVFTREGFSRWTVGTAPSSRQFVRWDGVHPAVMVKRVSSVWASLKIVCFSDDGKRMLPLECGFRCRQADLDLVQCCLSKLVQGESIADDHELIERLNNLHEPEFTSV